jgi:hypothetical protein
LTEAESATQSVMTHLGLAVAKLDKAEFDIAERQKALVLVNALARKFGMFVGTDVKPSIPSVSSATVQAAQSK